MPKNASRRQQEGFLGKVKGFFTDPLPRTSRSSGNLNQDKLMQQVEGMAPEKPKPKRKPDGN